MRKVIADNSLSDLSFDFLGVFEGDQVNVPSAGVTSANGTGASDVPATSVPEPAAVASGLGASAPAVSPLSPSSSAQLSERGDKYAKPAAAVQEYVEPASHERRARTVSVPRRHVWGILYATRAVILAILALCVGSLVMTLVLNPGLTFEGAVQLLYERALEVAKRIGDLLR